MFITKIIQKFLHLTDTPNSYTGKGRKVAMVKASEDGLEFSPVLASEVPITDAEGYWDVSDVEAALEAIGNWATNRVSKGWYTGGTVTCNPGALTVNVTSGTGNWGGTRNVSWDADSNVSITADSLNFIYVDTADSTVKNTTTKATADAEIPLAIVLANDTEAIKISPYRVGIADFHLKLHQYLKFVIGPVCENGMSVSINTPADLNIVVDTGAFHWGLFHFAYTTESPCSFTYWHKVTTAGVTRWVKTTAQTSINNSKYNLNTAGDWSYADLGSNKYRKDLVCAVPKTDGTIAIGVILGQEQFNSVSAARDGAIPTLGELETMGFASLAYVIIKQGASSIAEAGDMRPLLGQYGAMQDHGSLTGLGDDDHPQYMLKTTYDANTDGICDKAEDLSIAGQAAGDVLYFDGNNWVRLAKDVGKYLKSGASAVSWDTPAGVGGIERGALIYLGL